jgi:hypothetical protein
LANHSDACRATLEQFLSRRLATWTGLAVGCPEAELRTWLPLLPGAAVARLGVRPVEYTVRVVEHDGFVGPVQLYLRAGRLAAVGTEFWSFSQAECSELLRELGEPPHRLDLPWRHRLIPGGDHVYPARGLSLGVVLETGLIVTVLAYPPCAIETYREQYSRVEPARELPDRG